MPEAVVIPLKDEHNIFKCKSVEIKDYTIVVGCNGAGKSTLCKEIVEYCKANNIAHKFCDGATDFHQKDFNYVSKDFDPRSVLLQHWESEHEHIERMFSDFVKRIRPGDEFKGKDFFLLIDGLDSGGDVYFYKQHLSLFNLIVEDAKKRGIFMHLVVTCNNFYYLCHESNSEFLFCPTFRRRIKQPYLSTEFEQYEKDIMETFKARGFGS